MTHGMIWRIDGRSDSGRLRFRLWLRRELAVLSRPREAAVMLSEKGVPTGIEHVTDRFGVRS